MFEEAYKITMKHEGGYSNHPSDRGGETYKGISRKFHSYWAGWAIVDRIKNDSNISFEDSPYLQKLVHYFYKEKYWDSIKLDSYQIPEKVAEELFDISVNFGKSKAAKCLQRALNILNRDENLNEDLKVDGKIGNKTLSGIHKYKERILLKLIILLKAKFYIDIVERNTTQEAFIRGWMNRIILR